MEAGGALAPVLLAAFSLPTAVRPAPPPPRARQDGASPSRSTGGPTAPTRSACSACPRSATARWCARCSAATCSTSPASSARAPPARSAATRRHPPPRGRGHAPPATPTTAPTPPATASSSAATRSPRPSTPRRRALAHDLSTSPALFLFVVLVVNPWSTPFLTIELLLAAQPIDHPSLVGPTGLAALYRGAKPDHKFTGSCHSNDGVIKHYYNMYEQ